jgi:dolichyl-phosphate beta-glucosyltransferase
MNGRSGYFHRRPIGNCMSENASQKSASIETCIVVPCYNEAARLRGAEFADFVRKHDRICFLFVNDGSKDGTLRVLQQLCAEDPERLFCLDLGTNHGKAEAVRLGMLHCIRDLHPKFTGFWDADLATPLEVIPEFVDEMLRHPSCKMVFGSRVRLLGHAVKRKLIRHYLGRVFATVVSLLMQLEVYDTQCGAKVFRVDSDLGDLFAEPFLSRWIFDVEIIARVIRAAQGDRIRVENMIFEMPLMQWEDVAGSKVHPTDFLRAMGEIWAIRRRYLL